MGDTPPPRKKGWGIHFLKDFFDFEEKKTENNFGQGKAGTTEIGNNRIRERRNEETTERGNNWNDTTSAFFKNLVEQRYFFLYLVISNTMEISQLFSWEH